VHFAVGRYIRRSVIERAWGHGFVHIKLLGDLGVGAGALHEARAAARYLSKYVTKDLDGHSGLHRYEVAQGFQPTFVRFGGVTAESVLNQASGVMQAEPEVVWRSSEADWEGPPAVWAAWAA